MINNVMILKFANKRFKCKCADGRCPNYKKNECGVGGRAFSKKKSYDNVIKSLKKTLKHDEYVGINGYYSRSYKEKKLENKNGKQISVGEDG